MNGQKGKRADFGPKMSVAVYGEGALGELSRRRVSAQSKLHV